MQAHISAHFLYTVYRAPPTVDFKELTTFTFQISRQTCSPGGIRTLTTQSLNLLPSSDWATGPFVPLVRFELTLYRSLTYCRLPVGLQGHIFLVPPVGFEPTLDRSLSPLPLPVGLRRHLTGSSAYPLLSGFQLNSVLRRLSGLCLT